MVSAFRSAIAFYYYAFYYYVLNIGRQVPRKMQSTAY